MELLEDFVAQAAGSTSLQHPEYIQLADKLVFYEKART